MTTRKFNYTGRQTLLRRDVQIFLDVSEDKKVSFEVSAQLEGYGFPPEAILVAEAYERSRFERYELGTIKELQFPVCRDLHVFGPDEAVKFRLKVIGTGDYTARLLGEADQLLPELHLSDRMGSRISLLRTEGADLGPIVWELSLEDQPLLRVNKGIGNWRALAASPEFAFIAFPSILEKILTHVVIALERTPDIDLSSWESLWIRFAQQQPGVPEFPDTAGADVGDLKDWISAAVEIFCGENDLLKNAKKHFGRED